MFWLFPALLEAFLKKVYMFFRKLYVFTLLLALDIWDVQFV